MAQGLAAALSFFVPGLGQLYRGRALRGLAWLIAVTCGYLLLVVPGIILHLLCMLDAFRCPQAVAA